MLPAQVEASHVVVAVDFLIPFCSSLSSRLRLKQPCLLRQGQSAAVFGKNLVDSRI
jgi:hypothetical protein